MDKEQIVFEVNQVFKEVLDDDGVILNYETTSDDIEDWDSLAHIQLILALEKHFKVKFTSREMMSWKNVGEMADNINEKIR